MNQPKVFVIVLCYNGVDLTLGCLETIQQQDYPNLEICLVDNGSTDGSIEILSQKYPQAHWVKNYENLGYALGNNRGVEYALEAGAEVVFLVNNDTRLEKECVSRLVETLIKDTQIGIIGPMVYTWDGDKTISSAGGQVDWKMADAVNVGMGEKDTGQYRGRTVDFINGCGIMITRDAIQQAGLLDAKLFMYWEETDWCLRVKSKGFKIYFEPSASMEHKATIRSIELSPTTLYYMTRNRFLFFFRHSPNMLKILSLLRALKGTLQGIMINRRMGKNAHERAMRFALYHAIIGCWGKTDSHLWLNN